MFEKIVFKTHVLFFCWIQILALRGSVKAYIRLRGPGVSSLSCGENTAVCPLLVLSVSSGEKASFQKGSPDICCIVEYGVSGTMLISCVNRKTEKKQQKHILNHRCNTPLFTCVQSKAFKTPFCIFVPWFLIHTERAQRLYTLSTHLLSVSAKVPVHSKTVHSDSTSLRCTRERMSTKSWSQLQNKSLKNQCFVPWLLSLCHFIQKQFIAWARLCPHKLFTAMLQSCFAQS